MTKFELDEEEEKSLQKRMKKIKKKYGKCGHITYSFTPTGLGSVLKVHFQVNNKTYDITNLNNW